MNTKTIASRVVQAMLGMVFAATSLAATDIATTPLVSTTSTKVLPNLLVMMDDSGSMDEPTMPDQVKDGSYGEASAQCNGVYYDPTIIYTPPAKYNEATKTWGNHPNSTFDKAWINGFAAINDSNAATVNLNEKFALGLTTDASAPNAGEKAFYYKYSGQQTTPEKKRYYDSPTSIFLNECNTALAATVTLSGTAKFTVSSIKVGTTTLSGSYKGTNDNKTAGKDLADAINSNTKNSGFSAKDNGNGRITITGPSSAAGATPTVNSSSGTYTRTAFPSSSPPSYFTKVVVSATTAPIDSNGKQVDGLTNFANWFSYYRTRINMMKSGMSLAFLPIKEDFRVGFATMNNNGGNMFVNIADFTTEQKKAFYNKLYIAKPSSNTPLRSALSVAGRLYAGKKDTLNDVVPDDPVQYSCQKNYTLLSTDGFWNRKIGVTEAESTDDLAGEQILNVDGDMARPYGDKFSSTLADVAMYYYTTDLRTSNCARVVGGKTVDLCENNVKGSEPDSAKWQHMTTFTLGLGAPGRMIFNEKYADPKFKEGDYYSVLTGEKADKSKGKCSWLADGTTCNWPEPKSDTETTIDDLWHAAVNGRGSYFSATNPSTLGIGLANALSSVGGATAAAAAATVSNPNVSATDNFMFSSSFVPGTWEGDLRRRRINPATGAIETFDTKEGDWTAADKLDALTARTIYTYGTTASPTVGHRKDFTWTNLSDQEKAYFSLPYVKSLAQFCTGAATCLSDAAQKLAVGDQNGSPLFEFIRGATSNEGVLVDNTKYFRKRKHVLGDIVSSATVYVQKPLHQYADTGYNDFINDNTNTDKLTNRTGVVYVGSNDGMLHAFDATNGAEKWAYVPSFVLPTLYKLADKNYQHQFYVDGTPVAEDVYFDKEWHTILVGGLNAGGPGYYALDITKPESPTVLWEFSDPNLGLTFGKPKMTKLSDGTWAVLVASGYNNYDKATDKGDGQGHLWVLDAKTGTVLNTMSTGEGTKDAPSGLAQISVWADNPNVNATGLRAYGGDLLGNVWRFDINKSNSTPVKIAILKDGAGKVQPITAKPELGKVGDYVMVYVGTGQFLGTTDRDTTQQQSFYGIKDDLGTTTIDNPRASGFIQQTLTSTKCPSAGVAGICTAGEEVRTGSSNTVNFATDKGWYIDLPAQGERANTNPTLVLGTIGFNTNVPNTDPCAAGGKSYGYFLDYRTGAPVTGAGDVVSVKLGDALASDTQYFGTPGNTVGSENNLSDDTNKVFKPPIGGSSGNVRRVTWRELTTEK